MKLIVCVGEGNAVLFNHRRVSSDRAVIQHILKMTEGSVLACSDYSAALFPEGKVKILNSIEEAVSLTDYYFLEDQDPAVVADKVQELTVYRWNRKYPFDRSFPVELFDGILQKVSQGEFRGNSHERITWEVYSR